LLNKLVLIVLRGGASPTKGASLSVHEEAILDCAANGAALFLSCPVRYTVDGSTVVFVSESLCTEEL
jgi:hypothetical protein